MSQTVKATIHALSFWSYSFLYEATEKIKSISAEETYVSLQKREDLQEKDFRCWF